MKARIREVGLGRRCVLGVMVICGWLQPGFSAVFPNEQFSVQVDTPNTSTRTLIAADTSWRYFKGSSTPNTGWERADDVFLGASWLTGPSGFGYGDADDATVLGDMRNSYSTVYMRKTFKLPGMTDPRRLRLRMDYDDGFVALLDGREIARVNAPGAAGSALVHNRLATASHEAAAGTGGNPLETYIVPQNFGPIHRGTPDINHVLAIQGLNQTLNDDDLSLSASLLLEDYFTLLTGATVSLSGKAAVPGTTRVSVNGQNATFNAGPRTWASTYSLTPGMNRLVIQSWDASNNLLGSITNDVVSKPSSTVVSQRISNNTTWSPAMGVIEVSARVVVNPNVTLTIAPGTTVLFRPDTALFTSGGTINIAGSAAQPIYLLPADGYTPWNEIAASGPGSSITLRHAEFVAAAIHVTNEVNLLIEDSILRDGSHDRFGLEKQILYASTYCDVTVRRSHIARFYEMSFGSLSLVRFEDCLVQYAEDDAIKFDDSAPGSYIRACTVGPSAPGDDAIDFGAGARATVADCLIHHIFDRGISIGEVATVTVSNCLIHHVGNAIGVKDSSLADIRHVTLADSAIGLAVFEKFDGGGASTATVTNVIVWGNGTNVTARNPEDNTTSGSRIIMGYSIVQGSPVHAGTANLNSNPQFQGAASGNYQLLTGSPGIGSGQGGVNRGVLFPMGHQSGVTITEQPRSQTMTVHGILMLNVAVIGDGPFTYQWQLNGQNISGATATTYTRSDFQGNHEGQYRVRVTGPSGSIFSDNALVLLNSPLRIAFTPQRPSVNLRLIGPAGSNFVLQTTTNFPTWSSLSTNPAPNGIVELTVPLGPAARRYYRIRLNP